MRSSDKCLLIFWALFRASQGVVEPYAPSLEFCSESSINTYAETFTLNGTSAIIVSGTKSCRCSVAMQEPLPDIVAVLRNSPASRTSSSTNPVCNTRIDVFLSDGTKVQSLYCDWARFEVTREDLQAGLTFDLHVFDVKEDGFLDSVYQLHFQTGIKSHLTAHCSPPVSSTTVSVPSTTSTTLSTTTLSTTSAPTPISSGSIDTAVIVGVVVGLGLIMLVFISCLLCYIARRPGINDTIPQIPEMTQKQQNVPRPNLLQRTLSRARNTITRSRPLPKIPAVLRKFTLRRQVIDRNCQSGYYASIRSDSSNIKNNNYTSSNNSRNNNGNNAMMTNGRVIQQLSVESSSSYIHPREITPPTGLNATQQLSVESSASHIHPDELHPPKQLNAGADDNNTTQRKVVCTVSGHVASGDNGDYMNSPPRNLNHNSTIKEADDKKEKQIASVPRPRVTTRVAHAPIDLHTTVDDNSFYVNPGDVKIPNVDVNNDEYVEPGFLVDQSRGQAHETDSNTKTELNECSDASDDHLTNQRENEYENIGPNRLNKKIHSNEEETSEEDKYDNYKRFIANKNTDSEYENAPRDSTYLPMNIAQDKTPNGFKSTLNTNESTNDTSDLKESLTSTDSSPYMSMKGCAEIKGKTNLKKVDSTFPNLISFNPHGDSNQQKDKNNAEIQNVNNDLKQNKNKVKRYVKEKRTS